MTQPAVTQAAGDKPVAARELIPFLYFLFLLPAQAGVLVPVLGGRVP